MRRTATLRLAMIQSLMMATPMALADGDFGQVLGETRCTQGGLQRVFQIRRRPTQDLVIDEFAPHAEIARAKAGEKVPDPQVTPPLLSKQCPPDARPGDMPGWCFVMSAGEPNDADLPARLDQLLALQRGAGWSCVATR